MNILITGATGFIGSNLFTRLEELDENYNIMMYNRDNPDSVLEACIAQADIIYHLAGVNRSKRIEDFYDVNAELTKKITDIIEKLGTHPTLIFSSSTQAVDKISSDYALSKWYAENIIKKYNERTGNPIAIYRLPNVFGKWSKPNYNTVVATFCYNVAHGIPLTVNEPDKEISFVYIDDVVEEFMRYVGGYNPLDNKQIPFYPVINISSGGLAYHIKEIADVRKTGRVLPLTNPLIKYLSSMYLTYLDKNELIYSMDKHEDDRGYLCEIMKSPYAGQIFMSTTKPGITRGNHYHHTKTEKFIVLKGTGQIKLMDIRTLEVFDFIVHGDSCRVVDIPPGYSHSITNIGQDNLITLFWSNEVFNPDKPDTYKMEI